MLLLPSILESRDVNRTHYMAILRGFAWLLVVPWLSMSLAHGDDRGLLWKIESDNAPPSYLFGTMHTDDARVTDFSPQLRQALEESQTFMMEVLPLRDMTPIFMKQGSLQQMLTPSELDEFKRLAEMHSIGADVALRMKPWLLASIFSLPRAQSPFTQDVLLYGMAGRSGKQILGLESPEAHFGALDSLSDAEQLILLRMSLTQSVDEKEAGFEAIMQAYLDQEIGKIAVQDEKWLGGLPPELWSKVSTLLLDHRNAKMADGIVNQMKKSRVFVAVGAAHLPGKGGLIDRLRKAGYRLSAIQ
jgi:uncharacterized protein YbaP (TraB family)